MKAYAIKDPNDFIFLSSIKSIEENCKSNFLSENEDDQNDVTWEDLEEIGYRCVPVTITEVKTDK